MDAGPSEKEGPVFLCDTPGERLPRSREQIFAGQQASYVVCRLLYRGVWGKFLPYPVEIYSLYGPMMVE